MNAVIYLGQHTNLWNKNLVCYELGYQLFMHFLTPDQQKLEQVTGEKSVDTLLIYHTLFNVYASSNPA